MKTRTELIHRALRNLGVLPQGTSPNAEEYQSISDLIDGMLAELQARDIVYIKNIDLFEEKYLQPLGHILAWKAAPEFGAASDQALAALSQQTEEHLNEMERVAIRDYPPRTMRTDFPITRRTTI